MAGTAWGGNNLSGQRPRRFSCLEGLSWLQDDQLRYMPVVAAVAREAGTAISRRPRTPSLLVQFSPVWSCLLPSRLETSHWITPHRSAPLGALRAPPEARRTSPPEQHRSGAERTPARVSSNWWVAHLAWHSRRCWAMQGDRVSQSATLLQADEAPAADHDVIEQLDTKQLTRPGGAGREAHVIG